MSPAVVPMKLSLIHSIWANEEITASVTAIAMKVQIEFPMAFIFMFSSNALAAFVLLPRKPTDDSNPPAFQQQAQG